MATIGHIAWKELRSYYTSWIAYAILAGWLFVAGYILRLLLGSASTGGPFAIGAIFQNLIVILLFVAPMVTMRLVSEERSAGTIELLFTSPLSEWQVALGKWLGAVAFFASIILFTGHIAFIALRFGTLDTGPLWGSYLALIFLSMAFSAVGLFCSSLTESQVVAGFITFGALLGSWMLAWPQQADPGGTIAAFLGEVSLSTHFQRLCQGAVTTKDIIYFASITFFFLYATVRSLESRKWK